MTPDFRDRLASVESNGTRIPLFPAEVRGYWRTRRNYVQYFLMFLFLFLPWLKVNSNPAVLIDIQNKTFIFFGFKFWAYDGPYLFYILGFLTIGLALLTALFGRAWCGWACPQTVFLDGLFRKIEVWVEGGHLQRRELAKAPWNKSKLAKKILKWSLFILSSAIITHSFLAYFWGPEKVLSMLAEDPRNNWGSFVFIIVVNSLFLFNFTWFREQFCLIVCPYGRFQSVLLDSNSLNVHYDSKRGEPRRAPQQKSETQGACVDCKRCVQVCPTGIDIRNGSQMECIACTACIDACDEIMVKTKQPKGLISYRTSHNKRPYFFRPRILAYGFILLILTAFFSYSLFSRRPLETNLLRALDTPYFEIKDSENHIYIANSYRLRIHNQTDNPIDLNLSSVPSALPPDAQYGFPNEAVKLSADETRVLPFIVKIKKKKIPKEKKLKIKVKINDEILEADFVSPSI